EVPRDGNFVGPFESYVPSIIESWQRFDPDSIQQLVQGLQTLGVASGIRAEKLNESELELRVPRVGTSQVSGQVDEVGVADVGLGVAQVIPVMVALVAATRLKQLVHIE